MLSQSDTVTSSWNHICIGRYLTMFSLLLMAPKQVTLFLNNELNASFGSAMIKGRPTLEQGYSNEYPLFLGKKICIHICAMYIY